MCSLSSRYSQYISTPTNSSFMYTKCNMKHAWRWRCDLIWPRHLRQAASQRLTSLHGGVGGPGGVWCHTIDRTKQSRKRFGSRDLGQRVDGIQRRMELQTCTKVQLPHVSPGSRVLADEGAVLIERNLCPFAVVYQAVIAVWRPHYRLRGGLAPLKPLLLLTFRRCDSKFRQAKGRYDNRSQNVLVHTAEGRAGWRCERSCNLESINHFLPQSRWFISESYSVICRHLWKILVRFFFLMDLKCNNLQKFFQNLIKFAVNGAKLSKFSISIPFKRPWVIQLKRNRVEDWGRRRGKST